MGVTKIDNRNAICANAKVTHSLAVTPAQYYDAAANDVDSVEWRGGELSFLLSTTYSGRLYIQTSTSGTTPAWTRLLETMATTTSTSSTSTSTSTSSTTTAGG